MSPVEGREAQRGFWARKALLEKRISKGYTIRDFLDFGWASCHEERVSM